MTNQTTARLAAALLIVSAGVAISTAAPNAHATQVYPTPELAACMVKVSNDSVAVLRAPVTVQASLTEAIGDSISASLPRESNVSVDKVSPAPTGGPNSLALTLNTSKATPGDWTLSMKGTAGECSGKLKVTAK